MLIVSIGGSLSHVPVPELFSRTILEVFGGAGAQWLQGLPDLIAQFERLWSIRVGPPFLNLSYNFMAPAIRSDGAQVVLKLGVPNPELTAEVEALRFFDGAGAASLLAADATQGALLLERLVPGRPLSALDDEQATSVAADVMRRLWRPAPRAHDFRTVEQWAARLGRLRTRFGGGTGPLPAPWVERAEGLFAELFSSMGEVVVLHGDLHHDNILSAERQPWLALDPKGVVGEREYEVGALLRNPLPRLLEETNPGQVLARRIRQLAEELGLDQQRLRAWGLAQAVLSAWWSIEDHGGGWEPAIACAQLLAEIRPWASTGGGSTESIRVWSGH